MKDGKKGNQEYKGLHYTIFQHSNQRLSFRTYGW